MLKSLQKMHGKPAYVYGGHAEEIFQGQMDQQIAEDMAHNKGSAISDPLYKGYLQLRVRHAIKRHTVRSTVRRAIAILLVARLIRRGVLGDRRVRALSRWGRPADKWSRGSQAPQLRGRCRRIGPSSAIPSPRLWKAAQTARSFPSGAAKQDRRAAAEFTDYMKCGNLFGLSGMTQCLRNRICQPRSNNSWSP